jgi:exopolysaccharide biosynthesis polyprenyl glycosylphosphotransferase
VHVPFVVTARPRSLRRALEIVWADLLSCHLGQLVLFGTVVALLSYTEGLFDDDAGASRYEHILIALKIAFWTSLAVGVGLRLCGLSMQAATVLPLGVVVGAGLMGVGTLRRVAAAATVAKQQRSKNVLIVGTATAAARITKHLARVQDSGRVVKGIVTRYHSGTSSVLGTVDDLARIARTEYVDEIIVAGGNDRELAERAVAEAVRNHLDVSIIPDLFVAQPNGLSVQMLGGMPLIAVHKEPIPWLGLLLKRVIDAAVSAIALLLLLPWMMVIATAIKLESRGPVLYTALRVGKKGRAFKFYKFRTMCRDADHAKELLRAHNQRQGPTFKIVNDPRITPLGRILRQYSLDELPQLWNVLTGTMSLVGPRPHPIDDYQRYALEDRRRLDVAPGITGLWQVTAREDPSFSRNMALDLEYIENWSLRMDLAIVWKTLPAVLVGTGA